MRHSTTRTSSLTSSGLLIDRCQSQVNGELLGFMMDIHFKPSLYLTQSTTTTTTTTNKYAVAKFLGQDVGGWLAVSAAGASRLLRRAHPNGSELELRCAIL